jgi:hypothetical protein
MELDPKYVDVICRRWETFTGQDATLFGTINSFSDVAFERSSQTINHPLV